MLRLTVLMQLLLLSGCLRQEVLHPLTHDAYVWQRRWNNALQVSLQESAVFIRVWRVLAAETAGEAGLKTISVNRSLLQRMAKPVIAVIRVDGRNRTTPLDEKLVTQAASLAADWKQSGVPVTGIEIDYDCATSRLPQYARFLRLLRSHLARDLALSITALPSWIGNPELPLLLAEVQESVLQVHSVMGASQGLFDPKTTDQWVKAWSALSPGPFRIALPTYWSQVFWNEGGQVVAIESETTRYGTAALHRELVIDPAAVSSTVVRLRRSSVTHLEGIAWFRLPTTDDQRAWAASTWHAVMEGKPLPAALLTVRLQAGQSGGRDVFVRNSGSLDAKLPTQVFLPAQGCEFADALPPYELEWKGEGLHFRLINNGLLHAGQERLIGWARCSAKEIEGHVMF